MSGDNWMIAISIGVIALAFTALVIFLIVNLVSLNKTLKSTNVICRDLEIKIHAFDPYIRLASGFGESLEKNVRKTGEYLEEKSAVPIRNERVERAVDTSLDVAEWVMVGLSLIKKFKDRRK